MSKDIAAVIYAVFYAITSAGDTLAIKSLNYNASLQLPSYTALLGNQLWIFMVPIYWMQRKERSSKEAYWFQYMFVGCLTFTINILRNISLNVMPGSVFSLLISTSILFNIVLSKLILKKVFTYWHLGAAAFCFGSAISASLFTKDEMKGVDYRLGTPTAITAAFFLAIMNITQEYIQPTWDNYNVRIVELTIVSSIMATALTVVYGTFTMEMARWAPEITAATQTQDGLILVVCVSCALPILKLIVRNTKYTTINNSSAFFFEFAQSSGSLLGSIGSILVFGEPWSIGYIIAIVLMAISFALYIQTKNNIEMPPPPNYPKGDMYVMNPISPATTMKTVSTAKEDANGNIVVMVSLWK